jgi:hypothetical protein
MSKDVHRSPFTVDRSPFGVWRSEEYAKRPALLFQLPRASRCKPGRLAYCK